MGEAGTITKYSGEAGRGVEEKRFDERLQQDVHSDQDVTEWIAVEIEKMVREMSELEAKLIDQKRDELHKAEETLANNVGTTEKVIAEDLKVNLCISASPRLLPFSC